MKQTRQLVRSALAPPTVPAEADALPAFPRGSAGPPEGSILESNQLSLGLAFGQTIFSASQ